MGIDTQIRVLPPGGDLLADHPLLGGYRVVEGRYGTAVYGPIQISHLEGLRRTWEAAGYTIWDPGIASALGATIAATSPEGSKAWRAEIEEWAVKGAERWAEEGGDGDPRELAWALGCDTGRSAAAILYVLGSNTRARSRASHILHQGQNNQPAFPHDPDDLGRCIRLLDLFPAWRDRLGEVAEQHPDWTPLVRQWRELEALYRHELPSGTCPLTHARMQALGEEAQTATVERAVRRAQEEDGGRAAGDQPEAAD